MNTENSWPLWKEFPDEDRSVMASKYEACREWALINLPKSEIESMERAWQSAYGFLGPMTAVVQDIQDRIHATK